MQITNINSDFNLSLNQMQYIEEVLKLSIDSARAHIGVSVVDTTPIFLLNNLGYGKLTGREVNVEDLAQGEKRKDMEVLGMYFPKIDLLGVERSAIAICPERILAQVGLVHNSNPNPQEMNYLLVNIFAHEFAHAVLDKSEAPSDFPKTLFHEWMEESLANYIALDVLMNYRNLYFRFSMWGMVEDMEQFAKGGAVVGARDFIKNQPDNYRLGGIVEELEEITQYAKLWAQHKYEIAADDSAANAWLDYVQANLDNLDKEHTLKLYAAIFDRFAE